MAFPTAILRALLEALSLDRTIVITTDGKLQLGELSYTVLAMDLLTPPVTPSADDKYVMPAGVLTGAWAGFSEGDIASFEDGAWARILPSKAVRLRNADDDLFYEWDGEEWDAEAGGAHAHSFASLTAKPTTLVGYGITDALAAALRGAVDGVASLDGAGLLPIAQLNASAVGKAIIAAADLAAQLAHLGAGTAPSGTGELVLRTSAALITPDLGVATATKVTSPLFLSTSAAIAYGVAADFDVSVTNDAEVSELTGNMVLTLINGVDGCSGLITVRQDGAGSHTFSIAAAGRTVYRDTNTPDLVAATAADAITMYPYVYKTIDGVAVLQIAKSALVAA